MRKYFTNKRPGAQSKKLWGVKFTGKKWIAVRYHGQPDVLSGEAGEYFTSWDVADSYAQLLNRSNNG